MVYLIMYDMITINNTMFTVIQNKETISPFKKKDIQVTHKYISWIFKNIPLFYNALIRGKQ